ncbi:MAG TPA: NTP transferase domain-containing protein [Candidatus Acidoferrales bacterium]|nr:NTP transferase domain-containing protein [Candidatus Acidoferrales bacterium]
MEAIVMAGGKGTRFNSKSTEKPLIEFIGQPMIAHVIRELKRSKIEKITVAVSPYTPKTKKWVENSKLNIILTSGKSFIDDYVWAAKKLNIKNPFLTVTADIPLINKNLINKVVDFYLLKCSGALAVYIPSRLLEAVSVKPDLIFKIDDNQLVPVGLNVVDGKSIDNIQEEIILVLNDNSLAFNINTPSDLDALFTHYYKVLQRDTLFQTDDPTLI